jgi:hypothetical protein
VEQAVIPLIHPVAIIKQLPKTENECRAKRNKRRNSQLHGKRDKTKKAATVSAVTANLCGLWSKPEFRLTAFACMSLFSSSRVTRRQSRTLF